MWVSRWFSFTALKTHLQCSHGPWRSSRTLCWRPLLLGMEFYLFFNIVKVTHLECLLLRNSVKPILWTVFVAPPVGPEVNIWSLKPNIGTNLFYIYCIFIKNVKWGVSLWIWHSFETVSCVFFPRLRCRMQRCLCLRWTSGLLEACCLPTTCQEKR